MQIDAPDHEVAPCLSEKALSYKDDSLRDVTKITEGPPIDDRLYVPGWLRMALTSDEVMVSPACEAGGYWKKNFAGCWAADISEAGGPYDVKLMSPEEFGLYYKVVAEDSPEAIGVKARERAEFDSWMREHCSRLAKRGRT